MGESEIRTCLSREVPDIIAGVKVKMDLIDPDR